VPSHRPESLRVEVECAATSSSLGTILPPAELGWPSVDAPATLWHRIDLLEFLPTDPATQGPSLALDRRRSMVEQHPDSHLDSRQPRFSA
jgi:hypothetical protein